MRKALQDTGGAIDEFQSLQIELQHLEILLEYLHYGTWGHTKDTGHLNPIKGMASACQVPLREFLTKIEKYRLLQSKESETNGKKFRAVIRKMQWAVEMKEEIEKFRAIIVAKVVSLTLLFQIQMM